MLSKSFASASRVAPANSWNFDLDRSGVVRGILYFIYWTDLAAINGYQTNIGHLQLNLRLAVIGRKFRWPVCDRDGIASQGEVHHHRALIVER